MTVKALPHHIKRFAGATRRRSLFLCLFKGGCNSRSRLSSILINKPNRCGAASLLTPCGVQPQHVITTQRVIQRRKQSIFVTVRKWFSDNPFAHVGHLPLHKGGGGYCVFLFWVIAPIGAFAAVPGFFGAPFGPGAAFYMGG